METADASGANNSSIQHCSCYKVATLEATVLESTQISNLNDHYILKEQLGWGQFGVIRACSDKLTGEVLACKSIAKDRLVTPDDVRSVKLEIEIMARLSGHPNIVNLRAVYEEENYVHLLMELCMGGELFHLLEKHGRFSETEARFLFKHLMEVVKYCHDNGVIHRDLKPENILLVSTSPDSPIKLADFGLATYIKPGQYLRGTVGSPFYIAPEVLAGGYNEAADVWSAGVILYILLSGMPPFWGKTKSKIFDAVRAANLRFPASHWDRISASAKDLIAGMLRVDPSKRLTAAEVLAHSWMENPEEAVEQPPMLDGLRQIMPEVGIGSFSALSVTRIQDCSFNYGSNEAVDDAVDQSPTFSCKSSFSSFFVGNETPPSAFTGFSFSCELTSSLDFSSPIPSMPSFTFFSPGSAVEQQNDLPGINSSISDADMGKTGSGLVGKLFKLQDSPVCFKHETEQEPRTEPREKRTRIAWIQSWRNHTIGFGEHNQIDITVTESVIRWASCTHIPTAPSLRLSLVC